MYCAALRVERESCCFSIDHALVNSNTNYNIIIIQFLFVFGVCVLVMEGGGGKILGSYLGDGPRYRVLVGEMGGGGS